MDKRNKDIDPGGRSSLGMTQGQGLSEGGIITDDAINRGGGLTHISEQGMDGGQERGHRVTRGQGLSDEGIMDGAISRGGGLTHISGQGTLGYSRIEQSTHRRMKETQQRNRIQRRSRTRLRRSVSSESNSNYYRKKGKKKDKEGHDTRRQQKRRHELSSSESSNSEPSARPTRKRRRDLSTSDSDQQETPQRSSKRKKTSQKDTLRALLLVTLATTVAPGVQFKRRNDTQSLKGCTLLDYTSNAKCNATHGRLVCRGGFQSYWTKGVRREVHYLQLLEWPGECFNVGRLQYHFPELKQLEFVNCTALKVFKGKFTAASRIEKIAMHGLMSLWEVPPDIILEMKELREMDLRKNMLRHMKAPLLNGPPRLERVYFSGNHWDCSDGGLDWLAMENENGTARRRIADYLELMCHQQLYRGKPLHKVMDIIRNMRETCPDPCACVMTHVVSDPAGAVIPLITVDCASRQLKAPPSTLPPSTTTLRLEGNKINSIRAIVHNPLYKRLADLYLDNNTISAVKELEGSEWFTSFRVLSLRGNKLKQIPVYAFDKALQANNNIMNVFLGHNPWRCDCHFIPRFQTLLRKYKRVIRDLPDIKCSASDDKKTSLVQISTMPLGDVCSSDREMPITPINIVNIILFALIMIVLGRFLYDWQSYKTTGKLPWLSSVLP